MTLFYKLSHHSCLLSILSKSYFIFPFPLLYLPLSLANRETFFAMQMRRYADLYAATCVNLINYPLFYEYRTFEVNLPHEETGSFSAWSMHYPPTYPQLVDESFVTEDLYSSSDTQPEGYAASDSEASINAPSTVNTAPSLVVTRSHPAAVGEALPSATSANDAVAAQKVTTGATTSTDTSSQGGYVDQLRALSIADASKTYPDTNSGAASSPSSAFTA